MTSPCIKNQVENYIDGNESLTLMEEENKIYGTAYWYSKKCLLEKEVLLGSTTDRFCT